MSAETTARRRGMPAGLTWLATLSACVVTMAPGWSSSFASAPAGLREEVVLADTVVQGGRLDLRRFADDRSPEELREAVRRAWSTRTAPVQSGERDGWLFLTQAVGSAVETFEVRRRGGGSTGRRVRLSRAGMSAAEPSGWLEETLPQESRTLERVIHSDSGRHMTTLVALTSVGAAAALRQVVSALGRLGFTAGLLSPTAATAAAGGAMAVFLARGTEDIALTVSEHEGQCAVVIHWGRTVR